MKQSKAVMLSIQPRYCMSIFSHEKTLEIRKNHPAIDVPFKCYIYCTKEHNDSLAIGKDKIFHTANGMVIAEFTCDKIYTGVATSDGHPAYQEVTPGSCLTTNELIDYGKGDVLYGWHISDLVKYEPSQFRQVNSFLKPCVDERFKHCEICRYGHCDYPDEHYGHDIPVEDFDITCTNRLKRPPQSWCYIRSDNNDLT